MGFFLLFFIFSSLKMLLYTPFLLYLWWKNLLWSLPLLLHIQLALSLHMFKIVFLFLIFSNLIMICFGLVFFMFTVVYWPWIYRFIGLWGFFFSKFGKFQHLFFTYFSFSPFSSFWGTPVILECSLILFIFLNYFPLCVSYWVLYPKMCSSSFYLICYYLYQCIFHFRHFTFYFLKSKNNLFFKLSLELFIPSLLILNCVNMFNTVITGLMYLFSNCNIFSNILDLPELIFLLMWVIFTASSYGW